MTGKTATAPGKTRRVPAAKAKAKGPARRKPAPVTVYKHSTRETWLQAATDLLRPDFQRVNAPLPAKVHVSIGYTTKGMRGRAIGQCHDAAASADGVAHVFIVPQLADGARVLDVLVHELVHAAVGCKAGHDVKVFGGPARALGLEGKLTATVAGADLSRRLAEIIEEIGAYPHGALAGTHRVQSTRMLKVQCVGGSRHNGCGMIIRTTAKWLEEIGTPECACGAGRMWNEEYGYGGEFADGGEDE